MLTQDFGHLCRGRRIHTSGHADLGILCGGRSRQTSPYSLCAECAAGCLRASSAGRSGRSATGGA